MNLLLPALSALACTGFAVAVALQWTRRRRAFQAVWALGLAAYAVAAGAEAVAGANGWNPALYRAWYLCGAVYVAAWLGMGTVLLLSRTRFGYFVASAILLGGLLAPAIAQRYPGARTMAYIVLTFAIVTAVLVTMATARRSPPWAYVTLGALLVGAMLAAWVVLTAHLSSPGWATDPLTGVPIGSAMPSYVRVITGPFNIAGAMCLVFGALYSAYVYMPKRKVLGRGPSAPVIKQLYGALAVAVNLVASLPRAAVALGRGELNSRVPATLLIALGGFVPSLTSGLDRFGITWLFYAGELTGIVLILAGFLVSEEVLRSPARQTTGVAEPV